MVYMTYIKYVIFDICHMQNDDHDYDINDVK